jgi:hypothetical protein
VHTHSPKLILGAGRRPGHYTTKPGPADVTVDRAKNAGADIRQDLSTQSLPFGDSFFAEVYFEFFPYYALLGNKGFALKEAARVTAAGGIMHIDTGRPIGLTERDRVRQEIRALLEAAGFTVAESPATKHLHFEAIKA